MGGGKRLERGGAAYPTPPHSHAPPSHRGLPPPFIPRIGLSNALAARQDVMMAINSKLLRLNAAAVERLGAGKAVNMASSDVRRIDEIGVYWPYILVAPVELCVVYALLITRLGVVAATVGVGPLLLFVPSQAVLSRRIGGLRHAIARRTDARVRTMSEAVTGALTVKMLGLEPALLARLKADRADEAVPSRGMARIRAANMALFYLIFPLSTFCMFLAVSRMTLGSL